MALTDNLVAYWKADESSWNYADSIWSNTGTPTGTSYVAGKINNGISFSWWTSFVTLANDLGTLWDNPYTISMWVKPTTLDTTNGDLLLWAGDRNQQHIIGSDGKLNLTTYDWTVWQVVGTSVLTNWNWYHLVFQRTSGTAGKVWVNWVDDTSGTATMRNPASTLAQAFRLWSRQDNTSANFNGLEDEIGIWSRALSSTEISQLYNAGAGLQYPFSLPATFIPKIIIS